MRRNFSAYACEFAGTALMLFIGVSAVSFMWAPGSPVPVVENNTLRRFMTGIMFAGGGTAIVYSPLGQISGGHINPAVTLAFWRLGKVPGHDTVAYVVAQVLGAIAGTYAASDSQLRRITKHDMAHLLPEDPRRTEDLLRQLARRVKAANERLAGRA